MAKPSACIAAAAALLCLYSAGCKDSGTKNPGSEGAGAGGEAREDSASAGKGTGGAPGGTGGSTAQPDNGGTDEQASHGDAGEGTNSGAAGLNAGGQGPAGSAGSAASGPVAGAGVGGSDATGGTSSSAGTSAAAGSSATGGSATAAVFCAGLEPVADSSGSVCTGTPVELDPTPVDLYFMMQTSVSMTIAIEGTDTTVWQAASDAILQVLTDPDIVAAAPNVGIGFFSAPPNAACDATAFADPEATGGVPMGPIADNADAIEAAMGSITPTGQNPGALALAGALSYAEAWQAEHNQSNGRRTVVVFVTTNYQTACPDTSDAAGIARQAYDGGAGIRTYVIVPSNTAIPYSANLTAEHGGTGSPAVLDPTDMGGGMVTAVAATTSAVLDCTLAIPEPPQGVPVDADHLKLVYTPDGGDKQEIPYAATAEDCSATSGGYSFDNDAAPTSVTLCGCSCANLGHGPVEFEFGCKSQLAP